MSAEEVQTATSKPVIEDRVYVGNVDYKVTEDELKDLFKDLKVTDVEIPFKERTRDNETFKLRLGFAFVQFENKEEADKAIAELNGTRLQRRNIFLKKAVPPPTEEEKQQKIEKYKAKQEEIKQKREEQAKKKEERGASSKVAPEGEKSKDTIFVTNLDYKVNVKVLSKVFADLKPKWIHVPRRRFSKKPVEGAPRRAPLNKGIAFIKFGDEETQKRAVAEFNGKEVKGRELIVDYALNSKIPEKGSDSEDAEVANGEETSAVEN